MVGASPAADLGLADTSLLIAMGQERPLVARPPARITISVITVAELRLGVLAADDGPTRVRRLETLTRAEALVSLMLVTHVRTSASRSRTHPGICHGSTPRFFPVLRYVPAHRQTSPNIRRCNSRRKVSSRIWSTDLGLRCAQAYAAVMFVASAASSSPFVAIQLSRNPSASSGSRGVAPGGSVKARPDPCPRGGGR